MTNRPRDPDDVNGTTSTHAYKPKPADNDTDAASTSVHRSVDVTTDPMTATNAGLPSPFTGPTPSAAGAATLELNGDESAAAAATPKIPGFDILGEIGRGGMGMVFKARQLDLNRLVAIKMVLADKFDRPEDLVRFRLEAEMVARVHHPNVVQVFDSGAWEGHPYLVLEWIDGGTLGAYLTDKPQPPEVGARTVELLARAIHAAHCNGVVHRDLKPSNVLVAQADDSASSVPQSARTPAPTVNRLDALSVTLSINGRPVPMTPKIADFGIAKQLVGATHLTETGKILGTPQYMAPEQAEGRSDLTGPATDVYALGAILYQMLTGQTPFRGESAVALLRRVIEEEPRRPRAVESKIPRDLETVCLKCLAKHPLRRYQTAESLADDLCAVLEGRPISARRVGVFERTWKWAQRRPGVAALSMAAALFFVLGFAGILWQWDRAVKAQRATDAVNYFLINDMLATATPEKQLGRKVTVEEVLKNASTRIDGAFADQPEVHASVLLALGNSYRKLGLFEPADRHLTAALDLRRKTLGATHRDTLAAGADRGRLLGDEGKWDEAVPLLRQVVVDARNKLGPVDPLTIEATGRLALVLQDRGDTAEAEELFREALAAARRVFGPDDARTLTVLNDLGVLLQARKQLPEAEATFREAAAGRETAFSAVHPATLESLSNLAVVLDAGGRWTEAKPIFERVLADKRRVLGRDHLDTLSTTNNLARLLNEHGDPDAALPLFEEAYEGFRTALGPENAVTLKAENNLGTFAFRLGLQNGRKALVQRAATLLAAVLETRRRVLPVAHTDTLQSMNDLAVVLIALHRPDEAEPLITEALAGQRKALGLGHPDTLRSVGNYAQFLRDQRKLAEAIGECVAALEAAAKAGTTENPEALKLLCTQVELMTADKARLTDALEPAERAVALTRKVHGETNEETIRARRDLGMVLLGLDRPADAEPHLRAVYESTRATLGATHTRTARDAGKLGACLLAEKRYADAEPLLLECYQTVRGLRDVPKAQVRASGEQVVKLYEAWGKPEKAAEWQEKLK